MATANCSYPGIKKARINQSEKKNSALPRKVSTRPNHKSTLIGNVCRLSYSNVPSQLKVNCEQIIQRKISNQ